MNGSRLPRILLSLAAILSAAAIVVMASIPLHAQRDRHEEGSRDERERHFYGVRAYPYDRIPQNARLDALLQSDWKIAPFRGGGGVLSAQQWKPIGPFDMGGRVTSIAVHPTDGKTLWIGAADGGVWKSTDRGGSWAPVMDFEHAIAMGSVAVDPNNPMILYAGTGEASTNVDAYGGAGIMKSTDGGATWRSAGLKNVAAFSRVVVSPGDGRIVLAGALRNNAGLYRSSDAGATWTRIIPYGVSDITINPANPNEVWIGVGGTDGVMRSADGGITFTPSGEGLAFDGNLMGRVSVKVAPSMPNVLYLLAHEQQFPQGSFSRIYKSTNSGGSWDLVMDNNPNLLNYYGIVQGEYNNVIVVKPDDPNVVLAGGVVMIRSEDGGESWTTIDQGLHPDHHAFAFDPTDPERLYIGNDGGMYRSDDAGLAFTRISKGLAITQFYAMAIDQTTDSLTYGGTQDNGTITTFAADYWEGGPGVVGGGDGFHVVVDGDDPNIIYYEQPYGRIYRTDRTTGNRDFFTQGLPLSSPDDPAAWSAPLIGDPSNPDILYCGRSRVYRRTRSTSWTAISPRFKTPISALAVSPVDTRIIYAGSGLAAGSSILISDGVPLGEVKVSTDGGATWHDRSSVSALPNRVITEIMASPTDSCTAYIAYSGFHTGHIFKTTDCGASWRDISAALPDIPVNALAIHPQNGAVIYAGTDIGVYITVDGGVSWSSYNDGLPRAAVADLAIHHTNGTLRLATHGRSMWEIPLETPSLSPAVIAPTGREVWMERTPRNVAWSGLTPPLRLEYSLDDGLTWQTGAENITGNNHLWTVANGASHAARIRVTEMGSSSRSAVSSAFTIEKFRAGGLLASSLKAYPCWGLAYDGEYLWATVENSDTLLKLDRTTFATLAIVKVEGEGRRRFSDITYHPVKKTFFLHDVTDARLDERGDVLMYEISADGAILHQWPSPCIYPTGLAWIDDPDGGYLLASDLAGGQDIYVIDPDDGSVKRTITRSRTIELGPAGMTAAGDGRNFWQVIADFSFEQGPRGSTAVRASLDDLSAGCVVPLAITPDSTGAGGYAERGRLFARGVERDPEDGNLWVTNLDGGIYKFTICDAAASGVPSPLSGTGTIATIGEIHPNPFTTEARVRITLLRPAHLSLDLHDGEGRLVMRLADGYYHAGSHDITIDPSGLSSGIYHCRLAIEGGGAISRTVVHIR